MGGLVLLIDEQIKSGSHIRFKGHSGVVERLYLQSFSLRQYNKGLAYFPNGILLENSVEIQTKTLERRCIIPIRLDHSTPTSQLRLLIQKLDNFLFRQMDSRKSSTKERNVVGLLSKLKGTVDVFGLYQRSKIRLANEDLKKEGQFWVTLVEPYFIEVVYYTKERHMKSLMKEMTEVRIHMTSVEEEFRH